MKANDAIEDVAAEWLVRRQAGFTAGESARFQAWLAADPRHAAALSGLEDAWETLNRPRCSGWADEVQRDLGQRARRRTRRRLVWSMAALGGAAALALTLQLRLSVRGQAEAAALLAATAVAKPDVRLLADGTRVELNAGAEISEEFSAVRRDVRLLRGEALFSVTKDASRPFVVTASGVAVRAVGTEFSVRSSPGQVDVLVTEGHVTVDRIADSGAAASANALPAAGNAVGAGELAIVPLAAEPPRRKTLSAGDIAAALTWRDKRIEFTATPLAVAATVFNRRNRVQLSIADEATGRLKITGIGWTDDPEGFVRLIETGMDLQSERKGDTIVLRQTALEKSR